jgi:glycosyl transferase family 87
MRLSKATASGRPAMAAAGGAFGLVLVTAALGPSAAEVGLPGRFFFPLAGSLHPSPWLVTGLLAAAVLLSVASTAMGLAALRNGWSPSARRMLIAGMVAVGVLAIVPPVASADVLSYTAYGRIAALGLDPYSVRPDRFAADPIIGAVEDPWRSTPSIYGPLAVAEQAAVARVAGADLRAAVWMLGLVNAVAFAAAGWILYRLAGRAGPAEDEQDRRRRAVLMFALNPVLVLVVVAGGHIDALVVAAVVAALALAKRSPVWAGAAAGAGALVKLTAALPLAGWAWLSRRFPGRVARLAAGAGLVFAAGYAAAGIHAFNQARQASRFVSVGTPWRPVRALLLIAVNHNTATAIVQAGAVLLALALMRSLDRDFPAPVAEEEYDLARAGLIPVLAWALAAPYTLGWYDVVPWALLALLPPSRYDKILLAHTGMLAIAYLPGRTVALPAALKWATTILRSAVSPAVLLILLVLVLRPPARVESMLRRVRFSPR